MNIVVVVAGGAVEALQATPLVRSIRAAAPSATLVMACPPAAGVIGEGVPGVDEVVVLDTLGATTSGMFPLLRGAAALRRRRLDAAVLCSDRGRDRLLLYLSGLARRVGPAGGTGGLLLTDPVPVDADDNRAAAWLLLAEGLGIDHRLHRPAYDPGPQARRRAEGLLLGGGFEDGRLLVAVAPGMSFADRVPGVPRWTLGWEPDRYAHLANLLATRHGAGVVLLGGLTDRPAVDRMLLDLEAPVLDLCGEVGLVEAAAVVERCDLVVGGDSPLLHLAAAVGTPAIGLFGPTDGSRRGPYGPEHRVVQGLPAPGDPHGRNRASGVDPSMRRIRVDDVLAGIEAAF